MDDITEYLSPSVGGPTEKTLQPEKAGEQLLLSRQAYRTAVSKLYGVEIRMPGGGVYNPNLEPRRPVTKEAIQDIVNRRLAVLQASAASTRSRLTAGRRKEGDKWYDETIEKQTAWLERALAELKGERSGTEHLDEIMRQLDKEARADAKHRAELIRSNSPSPLFSFLPGSLGRRKKAERELRFQEAALLEKALLARADFVTNGYEQIRVHLAGAAS